jgi:hypothetical protein
MASDCVPCTGVVCNMQKNGGHAGERKCQHAGKTFCKQLASGTDMPVPCIIRLELKVNASPERQHKTRLFGTEAGKQELEAVQFSFLMREP